jgi:hypothetical protein
MQLPEWLLPTLACPRCKGPLLLPRPNELHCRHCGLAYPIRNGVPVLLPEEAEALPPSAG